jgi:hypothetical protein
LGVDPLDARIRQSHLAGEAGDAHLRVAKCLSMDGLLALQQL